MQKIISTFIDIFAILGILVLFIFLVGLFLILPTSLKWILAVIIGFIFTAKYL